MIVHFFLSVGDGGSDAMAFNQTTDVQQGNNRGSKTRRDLYRQYSLNKRTIQGLIPIRLNIRDDGRQQQTRTKQSHLQTALFESFALRKGQIGDVGVDRR